MPEVSREQFLPGLHPDMFRNDAASDEADKRLEAEHKREPYVNPEGQREPVRYLRPSEWNQNPNQMALPGTEHLSHPGAHLLSQGYQFTSGVHADRNELILHRPTRPSNHVSYMLWDKPGGFGNAGGEIGMVHTKDAYLKKGLASTLYGMARRMGSEPIHHSSTRTPEGDAFAHSSAKRWGGVVPTSGLERFAYTRSQMKKGVQNVGTKPPTDYGQGTQP